MRRTGSVYFVTLPAFQRCLEDGHQQSDDPERIPTGMGTGDGHLEAHHDLQAHRRDPGRQPDWESEDHSTCSLPDFIFSFLKRDLALESYTGNNERGLTRGFPFITSFTRGTASASVEVVERPPESKGSFLVSKRYIRYLNR
uniref:Uncharacterized protein n=1 Tax=Nelumbo nucifera TaxID=4432 RepID=A0A822XZP9_NELNU|nr:TPA_asm: hypothetical protein HUJ06_027161 [Nelumbo nucifera]